MVGSMIGALTRPSTSFRVDFRALALGGRADLVHDDRALQARVVGELAERLLERADDDLRARPLVRIAEALQLDRPSRVQERDTAPPGTMPFRLYAPSSPFEGYAPTRFSASLHGG
jgi:hypothetical protein